MATYRWNTELEVTKSTKVGYNIRDKHGNPAFARVYLDGEEGLALANLFVAAPKLLGALKNILRSLHTTAILQEVARYELVDAEWLDLADSAIAKAEG